MGKEKLEKGLILTVSRRGNAAVEVRIVLGGLEGPDAWGHLLADIVRHIGRAAELQFKEPINRTIGRVMKGLTEELDAPTLTSMGALREEDIPKDGDAKE